MNFLTKRASEFNAGYSFSFQKPAICPHCGLGVDAPIGAKHTTDLNGNILLSATCECTYCHKSFFFASLYNNSADNLAKNVLIFPSRDFEPFDNENLHKISEQFINMFNQAKQAEFNKNYELAAIGYRAALEILVKDYAVSELKNDKDEVAKKSLFEAIGEYLPVKELISTADVVRILGNDFTHYDRKYPQYDFDLLKSYMNIFMEQIEVLYKIKNPPFTRKENPAPPKSNQT